MSSDYKKQKKELLASYAQQQIIDAVIEIIDSVGIKKLTMSKVAQKAGVAKGTLYSYFESKEDLIESAIRKSLEPLTLALNEIIESNISPEQKLEQIVDYHLSFFSEHKDYFRVLIYEHRRSQEQKKRFVDSQYQEFLEKLTDIFENGIDQGIFKSNQPNMLAVMFSEALTGLTVQYIIQKGAYDLSEAKQTLVKVFFEGIKN